MRPTQFFTKALQRVNKSQICKSIKPMFTITNSENVENVLKVTYPTKSIIPFLQIFPGKSFFHTYTNHTRAVSYILRQ